MATEKRLIDVNELNRALVEEYHGMLSDETVKIYQVIRMLDESPTVDAVEVVHGRWNPRPYHKLNSKGKLIKYCDFYFCSECGTGRPIVPPYNYCPNCGAKLDLEVN